MIRDIKTNRQRVIGLDMFRVALALLIFMFHSQGQFNCVYHVIYDFVSMGAIAMTGFFLLSGYVLYISYADKDLMTLNNAKQFYIKRAITILPLYFFIAVAYTIFDFIRGNANAHDYLVLFPVETFCLQSVFSSLYHNIHNRGTWFISCIVICYAIYPFLQTMLRQLSNRTKLILILCLTSVLLYSPIVRLYFNLQPIYSNPFFRALEFTIGILLAQINCSVRDNKILNYFRTKYSLVIAIVVLITLTIYARHMGLQEDFMLYNWIALPCFAFIMIALGFIPITSLSNNKQIIYLSNISFAFFLIQVLPLWLVSGKICSIIGSDANLVKIVVSFSVCFLGAILIHECVEKPASSKLRKALLT